MRNLFLILLALGMVSGCKNGPCRADKPMPENVRSARPSPTPLPTPAPKLKNKNSKTKKAALTPAPNEVGEESKPTAEPTLMVYRYDGSLQCGMGKAVSVDEMEKQLKTIKVVSRSKKPDGLMHIQVCGQPTGMVNVYEISQQDLGEAETYGFKKWDIN